MEKKDLQELQEITGLVSEKELSRKSRIVDNPDLQYMVGVLVRVGKKYGLIDAVHGNRLGFVWSDKDSWTGELVELSECELLSTKADIDKAAESARVYLRREHASIESRMLRKYSFDNQQELANQLWHIEKCQEMMAQFG